MKIHGIILKAIALITGMSTVMDVYAEPGVSHSHLPFLWVLAAGVAGLLTWVVFKFVGRSPRLKTPLKKWGLVIILMLVFLVFVSPIIVALGSIMITGRTM